MKEEYMDWYSQTEEYEQYCQERDEEERRINEEEDYLPSLSEAERDRLSVSHLRAVYGIKFNGEF